MVSATAFHGQKHTPIVHSNGAKHIPSHTALSQDHHPYCHRTLSRKPRACGSPSKRCQKKALHDYGDLCDFELNCCRVAVENKGRWLQRDREKARAPPLRGPDDSDGKVPVSACTPHRNLYQIQHTNQHLSCSQSIERRETKWLLHRSNRPREAS